jgi:proton-dependent oligopeptide transporter, POT family
MATDVPAPAEPPRPFPKVFWTANVTELFERAAYYSMASVLVIYLGQLGLGKTWPAVLSSSVLWALLYFLPIFSGTIADIVGFRRALLVAFVLLAAGYFLMGMPVWLLGAALPKEGGDELIAGTRVVVPVVVGIVLIGIGGSVVKPCISGTVQKTHAGRATLAFAIFYMVINIGSLVGRLIGFLVRRRLDNSYIFAVGAVAALVAFFLVLLVYRDPESLAAPDPAKPRRTPGQVLLGMVTVLRNLRFLFFLLVSSGFWLLYNQVYVVVPLYTKKVLETNPAIDIYTAANPLVIVAFQLLVTKLFGKVRPIRSIVVGTVIISAAWLVNIIPLYTAMGPYHVVHIVRDLIPLGSVFIIMTVALVAFGELFTSSRTYEWIGALAPKGQEGLFLGYVNLPMAIGSFLGGYVGAWIFNDVMCKGAATLPSKLRVPIPAQVTKGWTILAVIGAASAVSMALYNAYLRRADARAAAAKP